MTIHEFAKLCSCNPQTLRYYDRIGLLRPARVDPWTGYRDYDGAQALDFVTIKNLQLADFSIREIRALLHRPAEELCTAFDRKLAAQEEKLRRIREIRASYLEETKMMENNLKALTDDLLDRISGLYDLALTGLGADTPPDGDAARPAPDDCAEEPDWFDSDRCETLFEAHGWERPEEFLHRLSGLAEDAEYGLLLETVPGSGCDGYALATALMDAALLKNNGSSLNVSVRAGDSADGQNHFRLLRRRPQ